MQVKPTANSGYISKVNVRSTTDSSYIGNIKVMFKIDAGREIDEKSVEVVGRVEYEL